MSLLTLSRESAVPPGPRWGPADIACHVILHIGDPRFASSMESHDGASIISLALVEELKRIHTALLRALLKARDWGRIGGTLYLKVDYGGRIGASGRSSVNQGYRALSLLTLRAKGPREGPS